MCIRDSCNASPRRKIPPPTGKLVVKQSLAVYVFSAGAFLWAYYLYARGLIDYSLDTVVTVWISTRALLVLPPLLFCIGVCIDVWWRHLLPRRGRTRVLSLYFLRVIVVFLLTWIPYFILYEVSWNITYSTWMVNCSYYLSSVQGTLSVLVAMSKPDIKNAVYNFLCSWGADRDKELNSTKLGTSSSKRTNHTMEDSASSAPPDAKEAKPAKLDDEWFEDDEWEWGNYDLDVMLKSEGPDHAQLGVTVNTSTKKNNPETFADEDVEGGRPKAPRKDVKPVQDHAEWLEQKMKRFRDEQESELQKHREVTTAP